MVKHMITFIKKQDAKALLISLGLKTIFFISNIITDKFVFTLMYLCKYLGYL